VRSSTSPSFFAMWAVVFQKPYDDDGAPKPDDEERRPSGCELTKPVSACQHNQPRSLRNPNERQALVPRRVHGSSLHII
jgi:hypothetical protein